MFNFIIIIGVALLLFGFVGILLANVGQTKNEDGSELDGWGLIKFGAIVCLIIYIFYDVIASAYETFTTLFN